MNKVKQSLYIYFVFIFFSMIISFSFKTKKTPTTKFLYTKRICNVQCFFHNSLIDVIIKDDLCLLNQATNLCVYVKKDFASL